mgnify:CR=1 FL=1
MTIKPLNELKKPSNASTVAKSNKAPHSIDNYEHHSWHREQVSKHYHKEVATNTKTDTGQFGDKKIAKLEAKKRQAILDKRLKRKQALRDLVSPPVVKEQQPEVELQSEVQVGKPPTDLKKVNANLIRLEQQKKQLLRAVELRGQIAQAQMQLAILRAQQEAEQDEEDSILALLL